MTIETPVAFIIFNRPDTTEQVFQAIRQAQPPKLLVVADGPRADRPGEAEKCAAARAVIDQVDWDCEVLRNFSEVNLGCKRRVSSGLDWVFSEVEEAIVLEDDCLPDADFFGFCAAMLARYRWDERVMMISGDNFQPVGRALADSYYFSKYVHVWGWASWRRAWQHYDVEMTSWPVFRAGGLARVCEAPQERRYWRYIFGAVAGGKIDTWDYQWLYACWRQGGLSVMPGVNLVSNLGIGRGDATHTVEESSFGALGRRGLSWPLVHPRLVACDRVCDDYTFRGMWRDWRRQRSWWRRLGRRLGRRFGG
jgi:hypothetical protein